MNNIKDKVNNLNKCKNLKEISQLFSLNDIQKFSFFILCIWFLSLPFLFSINIFLERESFSYIWLTILYIFGFCSFINSIFIFYKIPIKKYKYIFCFFILYILWALISCFFANNRFLAFFGSDYLKEGFITYICYFFIFFNAIILDNEGKQKIFKIFSIMTFIMSIIVLIGYYFKIDFNFYRTFTSIFFNENHSAYYFMMGYICTILLFIFNSGKKYIAYLLISLIILHNLVLNDTLGCYLTIIFILLILFIYCLIIKKNLKKMFIVIISFVLISLTGSNLVKNNFKQLSGDFTSIKNNLEFVIDDSNILDEYTKKRLYKTGTNRFGLWLHGLKFISEKPIFGYGIENLYEQYLKTDVTDITRRPHNEYIQVGACMGIPALIFYLCFLGSIYFPIILNFKKINNYIIISAFIALSYLVSAFFGVSVFYTTPYLFIFLGFVTSYYIEENEI